MHRTIIAALSGLLLSASLAFGQATAVQQVATRADAAQGVAYATAGQGAAAAATISVPGGLFAYITGLAVDLCANNTGATVLSNGLITSSGIVGAPSWQISSAGTANTCVPGIRETFSTPLKSANAGVPVVITSPTQAQSIFAIRVYYYVAP